MVSTHFLEYNVSHIYHVYLTMDEFVTVIKKQSNDLYSSLQTIQRGRNVANKRKAVRKYMIPEDYWNWQNKI